jgi:hypothetical protein
MTFMLHEPGWKPSLWLGGSLMLLAPVGWPIALGYRKRVAGALMMGSPTLIPSLRGQLAACFFDGIRATCVILAHYTPYLMLYWLLGLDGLDGFRQNWVAIAILTGILAFLVPVFLPIVPIVASLNYPWIHHTTAEIWLLLTVFVLTTVYMPAAFVQASLTGRFRSTFRADRALGFMTSRPVAYARAWAISLAATIASFVAFPVFPWMVFWSYLVIVYAFNDALCEWNHPLVRKRARDSVFLNNQAGFTARA